MLAHVLREVIKQGGVKPELVEDIMIGNVLQPGAGAVTSRMATFLAGIPHTTSLQTVNRQCSSGLQAIAHISHAIKAGSINIGIAGGVENMSMFSFNDAVKPDCLSEDIFENEDARNCLMGMGVTSDNVAKEFGVSRQDQDAFAAKSQAKAVAAQESGDLQSEISPMTVKITDENGNEKTVVADKDEGVRKGTTAEKLGKLKPAFGADGTTTAGNASQVTDGAAAVLLA